MRYARPVITNQVSASFAIAGVKGARPEIESGPRQLSTVAAYSADE